MRRPRLPGSLRERLALAAVLVTAGALAALTLAFGVVLHLQLDRSADDLLRTRADAVVAELQVRADGTVVVGDAARPDPGTWVFAGGVALVRAAGPPALQDRAAALAGDGVERTVDTDRPEELRLYARPVRAGGRTVATVVSSVVLDPYERVRGLALLAAAALAALVLLGTWLLTRVLVARALSPVAEMTGQAARWSEGDVDRRFGTADRPVELERLAQTLDGVLDRLSAVLRHERQLSAELSHELRTPLSAVVAEVELLSSRPRTAVELAEGHAAVLAAAERMSRVLESLLSAARAGASPVPGRCDVPRAVGAAVASLSPPDGAVQVVERTTGLVAGADGPLVERALAPVVENALRARREQVRVELRRGPAGPEVMVQDDGPGVPDGLGHRVFEPGVSSTGGAGLGLALARRLARAGGGDLRLEPAQPGTGACFVLQLPEG